MTTPPTVSVITPTFNLLKNGRKAFFLQMLKSIQIQSYPQIEHILVDGASSDGTLDFFKELSSQFSFTVFSEKDSGIYDAMNKGIDRATGKYILILNSDDFLITQEAIQDSVNLLEKTQSDYSFANCLIEDQGKSFIFSNCMHLFWKGMPFSHQTMLCKKSLLLRFSKFDTSFPLAADYDFILKCILHDVPHCYLPETISAFRTGGASGQSYEASLNDQLTAFMKACATFYTFPSRDKALDIFTGAASPTPFLRALKAYLNTHHFKHFDVASISENVNVKQYLLFGILPLFKTYSKKQ